jgi:hypothetical protein
MSALLFAALAQAQATAGAVGKASQNQHHKYSYASSEAIIGEAREALSACGLALFCSSAVVSLLCDIETSDQESGVVRRSSQWQVECTYTLVHSGGDSLAIVSHTPVLPEKGRPLDKAVATAKTYDLAYSLRSLLLLPRVDPRELAEEPVDQRRDAPPAAPVSSSEAERLAAAFRVCDSPERLVDLTNQASKLLRNAPTDDPIRLMLRDALKAAQARVSLCARVALSFRCWRSAHTRCAPT